MIVGAGGGGPLSSSPTSKPTSNTDRKSARSPKKASGPGAKQRPRSRGGRPTLLTPELGDRIITLLRAGNTIAIATEAVGISRRAFELWMRRGRSTKPADAIYAEFAERVTKARAEGEARSVAQVASAAGADWRAAAWLLERAGEEGWSKGKRQSEPVTPPKELEAAFTKAAAAAREEAEATLSAIGEDPTLSEGAIARYASAVGVWKALEAEWALAGRPGTVDGGAHPLPAAIGSARKHAAELADVLGLDPQARRRLSRGVAGRPPGAASAPDRAAPMRRTLRSVS